MKKNIIITSFLSLIFLTNNNKKRHLDDKKSLYNSKINEIIGRYREIYNNDWNNFIKISDTLSNKLYNLGSENLKVNIKKVLVSKKIYNENLHRDLFIYHTLKINIDELGLDFVSELEKFVKVSDLEKSIYQFNKDAKNDEKTLKQYLSDTYPWNSDYVNKVVNYVDYKNN